MQDEIGPADLVRARRSRDDSLYVENELFVFPMAAYERALLFIMQHSQRTAESPDQATNYDLLVKVERTTGP